MGNEKPNIVVRATATDILSGINFQTIKEVKAIWYYPYFRPTMANFENGPFEYIKYHSLFAFCISTTLVHTPHHIASHFVLFIFFSICSSKWIDCLCSSASGVYDDFSLLFFFLCLYAVLLLLFFFHSVSLLLIHLRVNSNSTHL